jgi:hypothetical protein
MRIATLLIGCLLTAPVLLAQGTQSAVSGVVRDELGRPLLEALVVIDADSNPLRARTDAEGRFRIAGVSVGRHEIRVVRIGYAPHSRVIDVGPDGLELTIELRSVPIPLDTVAVRVSRLGLHGTVVSRGFDLMPHDPVAVNRAIVEVVDTRYRATTAGDGSFSIPDLTEGSYSILVRRDWYQSRILPVYIPRGGGTDITIVLDSTIADWQRTEDAETRDIVSRVRWANYPSVFVSRLELVGPEEATLHDALRFAPSTLSRGLLIRDDIACIYLNGKPEPGMTTSDILARDVHAVEVYGLPLRGGVPAPRRPWPALAHCGTGTRQGPNAPLSPSGIGRGARRESDTFARVIVVWLHRR